MMMMITIIIKPTLAYANLTIIMMMITLIIIKHSLS